MSAIVGWRFGLLLSRRGRQFSYTGVSELAPCLMLPPHFTRGGGMTYNFYSPIKGKKVKMKSRGGREESKVMRDELTELVGSSHGWLALFNLVKRSMCLLNPLTGGRINLPPLLGDPFGVPIPDTPRTLEQFRKDEMAFADASLSLSGLLSRKREIRPYKVILSCSPAGAGCRAIMVLFPGDRAATCRPGLSEKWTPLDEWGLSLPHPMLDSIFGDRRCYIDFVYSAARRRLFTLVASGLTMRIELEGWDIDTDTDANRMDPLVHRFSWREFKRTSPPEAEYLVSHDQSDQLFLVRRYAKGEETVDFEVYRIHHGGDLELCSSLFDDLAMFVGINHSFAVEASPFPGLKPNSIYFSDARISWDNDDRQSFQTIEVFDHVNKTCYASRHQENTTHLPWFTPIMD